MSTLTVNDVVPFLPEGYRWVTNDERNRWNHPAYFGRMVQVRISDTRFTYLAIKES